MSEPQIDLRQLAIERTPTAAANPKSRRRWLFRYALPTLILLGFCGLLATAAGTQWLPRRSVTVVPVMLSRAAIEQPSGTPQFQAAGWIEPRPTPINVAALAPGVIEELLVVEGQQVDKGEAIAKLIAADAQLALRQAEATLAIRVGDLKRAQAELRAAQTRVEQPLHLEVQLAEANSLLAAAVTEQTKLPFLIEAAQARYDYTLANVKGKRSARSSISGRILDQAESEHTIADANLRELRSRSDNLQREVDALTKKSQSVQRQLKLLVEETRQLQEAAAKLESAEAVRDEAQLQVDKAKLMLDRTTIRAPIAGRVLRLVATPGSRVMGLQTGGEHSSSTVIQMYDPARLQVRADVRLEDVASVQQGQTVHIQTASSTATIQGRVLQVTSSANVQKNTLEVKVELLDPPATVSPEMLVTATFLAPPTPTNQDQASNDRERILLPRRLVQSEDSATFVWVVDEDNRAQRLAITLGEAASEELVEVAAGLRVTDKIIASNFEGLEPGTRVRVIGEDQTMGVE